MGAGIIRNQAPPVQTTEAKPSDAMWCKVLYARLMSTVKKRIRQSVSLPSRTAKRVRALAKTRQASASRVLVELIETGLESKENEKSRFFALADRLSASTDAEERRRIKKELARMTFGE